MSAVLVSFRRLASIRWSAASVAAVACLLAGGDLRAQSEDEPDPEDTVYATGARPTPTELLSKIPKAPAYRAFLPESVDLSARFPAPGDQGRQSSCVAWAVGYAARSYYEAIEGNDVARSENVPSPAYIYNVNRHDDDDACQNGMYIPHGLDTLTRGAVSLADMPYRAASCARPSDRIAARATRFTIRSFQSISPQALDTIRGEIAAGNPVVFGMRVAKSFERHRGGGVYRRWAGEAQGSLGHAMVLVGYDERKQAFRLQNSWSSRWGDRGRAWLAYDDFREDAYEAYVMRAQVAAPPKTAPAPQPPRIEPDREPEP